MRPRRDLLWKDVMEYVFEDFLRFLFKDADKIFDWQKGIRFLDKELTGLLRLPGNKTGTRIVDKLAEVNLLNGKELLIHVEVQGYSSKVTREQFGERMFTYFYRIYDHYRKPLIAISIYTGSDNLKMPAAFEYKMLNTFLQYRFKTIRIKDHTNVDLAGSKNVFAWVLLIATQGLLRGKNSDKRLLQKKLEVLGLLSKNSLLQGKKLQALYYFLNHYKPFKNTQAIQEFENRISYLTTKIKSMDIVKRCIMIEREEAEYRARRDARKEFTTAFVTNLLDQTDFPLEKIAKMANTTEAFVRRLQKKLIPQ